jgi:hypothetical protein
MKGEGEAAGATRKPPARSSAPDRSSTTRKPPASVVTRDVLARNGPRMKTEGEAGGATRSSATRSHADPGSLVSGAERRRRAAVKGEGETGGAT